MVMGVCSSQRPATVRGHGASRRLLAVDFAGGFVPVDVSQSETWVNSSEMAFPEGRKNENNRVLLAKILWKK